MELPSWSTLQTMVERRITRESASTYDRNSPEVKQLKAAVIGLHWRSSAQILKLLRDDDDFALCYNVDEEGLPQKIDVEKLVEMLPLHLLALLISEKEDKLRCLLRGIRLLTTLCDLTSRHAKLEQVLLDDVKLVGLVVEVVILALVVFGGSRKESWNSDNDSLIEATLVASCLNLLHGFISPNYQELVQVLLAHPRVDVFIHSAFGAVHNVVRSLKMKFVSRQTDLPIILGASSMEEIGVHCLQAEAALQFVHSLCQHKLFRDRLVQNKELCGNGSILMLAHSMLSLAVSPAFVGAPATIASLSRMKAKVLSILHHLYEVESVSFLDEVVSAGNLELAKTIASEVLNLLRVGFSKASKGSASSTLPAGFVLLNSMRLADVLSDDSNFRPFFTEHFSWVISAVFCLSHRDFLSMLCSSELSAREDDATLDYDQHASAGFVLSVFSSSRRSLGPQFKLNLQNNLTMSSYAHQRTALFVKIIANLHCFVPNVCQEKERNRFVQNFMSGLRKDPLSILDNLLPGASYTPVEKRGTGVCTNLGSLLRQAESLIPNVLNHEDVLLLRAFCDQLQPLISAEFEESQGQGKDIQGTGGDLSGKQLRREPLNLNNEEALENADVPVEGAKAEQHVNEEMEIVDQLKESDADANNLETSGSDTSSNRGNRVEDGELGRTPGTRFIGSGSGEAREDGRAGNRRGSEQQRKKRKRSIMNDDQMGMIEQALADEPDMQRNSAWIQSWAEKLSQRGSEVITSSQLKNWLNNRKAKLARAASKQTGPVRDNNSSGDLAESPGEENGWQQNPSTPLSDQAASSRNPRTGENPAMRAEGIKLGQIVMLMDERGDTIGRARVFRTEGEWFGLSLETRQVCVVDVLELTGAYDWKAMLIPHGSDDFGRTFGEALLRFGVTRVAWDLNKVQPQLN